VNTTPTVSALSGSICSGQSFTINPSGASTYTYSGGSAVVSPTATSSYSVTGTSAQGCVSIPAVVVVTVNTIPILTVSSQTICSGGTATLTASGASTYSWSTGATTGSITVTPTVNTTYTLNGVSASGCTAIAVTASVVLGPAPSLTVNSATICAGESATLTASGVSSYSWGTGASTPSIVVSPSATAVYTLSGQQAGCPVVVTASAGVQVNALPLISVSGNTVLCAGQSTSLTALGASSYSWSTGAVSSQITLSPSVTASYTVTGTNTVTGCKNVFTQSVVVNALPLVGINGSLTVCNGSATQLNASGALSYTWNTGASSTTLSVNPPVTTNYSVSGMDANGCLGTASVTVNVSAIPVITVSGGSVCAGQSFTFSPSGAISYTYNPGGNPVATPSATTIYTISGSNATGCTGTATAIINVLTTPTVSAGTDITVTSGDTFTLGGTTNASSYTWAPSQGLSNPNSLQPTGTAQATTVFTLIVNSAGGCTASSTVMLVVNNLPVNNRLVGELQIANYMSPNGDGQNDTWKVNNPSLIKDYEVNIVDQWGNTIYSKNGNYNNDWDGTRNGQILPDGVYYYIISEGGSVKYSGSITILR
ncbi:MAG: gliding motility-associated C-terminal domain-containing protein, partial [Sediminibacterium sp.]|nr:gliding motility-associated C-terminal domain-containing protein [Sediminibacterium sp.]